jgi:hypothetical protein
MVVGWNGFVLPGGLWMAGEKVSEGVWDAVFRKVWLDRGLERVWGKSWLEKLTKTDMKPTENDQNRHEIDLRPT